MFLLVDRFRDCLCRRHNRCHLLGCLRKRFGGLPGLVLRDAHPVRNLLGRALSLGGELFNFRRNDTEAAAGASGARRVDRRVQREQIGLRGDGVDHFHEGPDLLAVPERSAIVVSDLLGAPSAAVMRLRLADLVARRHERRKFRCRLRDALGTALRGMNGARAAMLGRFDDAVEIA